MRGMPRAAQLAWIGLGALVAARALAQTDALDYAAQYSAAFKGKDIASSVFAVRPGSGTDRLTYSSETRIKGVLRMARPNPIIDRSEFSIEDGRIVPHEFVHEDGSRKGDDNFAITFDWSAGTATIRHDSGPRSIDVAPGTLDLGSLQVALMLDLRRGVTPDRYTVVDEDSTDTYRYENEGTRMVETGLGAIEVVRLRQTREGSSRVTTIDFAPSLGYVPVRIEQTRDGESQSAFVLQSIEH